MANFVDSYLDFSQGEIDPRNVYLSTNPQTNKGCSLLDNFTLSKTRGIQRRTGTINVGSPKYPVDLSNHKVVSKTLFVGKGYSFVGMMYVVETSDLNSAQILEMADDSGVGLVPPNSKALVMDWYRSTGDTETYLNSFAMYIDHTAPLSSAYYDLFPVVTSNEWTDVYGFATASFQTYSVYTHHTGCIAPFVVYYNEADNIIDWFNHSDGLYITNKGYWPYNDISNAFSRPFEQANLNPKLGLSVARGDTDDIFNITSKYYNDVSDAFEDWSSVSPPTKPHPLSKRIDYLRITILNNNYILKYSGTETSPGVIQFLDDLTSYDTHRFRLLVDGDDTGELWTVVSTEVNTTDFNLESFNRTDGFPDNAMFFDQRLLFTRDGRIFNSGVGNAFFFNQYRFAQPKLQGVYLYYPPLNNPIKRELPLLIDYSGAKVESDAFDFTPLSEALVDASWLNKSQGIEFGTYSEVNNISGLDDSIYSFNSIKSLLGTSHGSKKSISLKAGPDTIFVDGSNKYLRNYYYNGQIRTYVSSNLNDLSPTIIEHLMDNQVNSDDLDILEVSYNQDSQMIYAVIGPSQSLVGLTYDRLANKSAWSRVTLGDSGIPAKVYSSSFLRNDRSDSTNYIVTLRDHIFYLEKFAKEYNKEEMNAFEVFGGAVTVADLPYYLDFSRGFRGATSTTWNVGMEYAGTQVSVLSDGFWVSGVPVDALGVLVLDRAVRTLVVGYPYKSRFRTLNAEPTFGEVGDALHWIKHINYVHLRLRRSYGGMICTHDLANLEKIPYPSDHMIVGESLKLHTGPIDIHLSQSSGPESSVYIETEAPYPFELLAINIKGEVNER